MPWGLLGLLCVHSCSMLDTCWSGGPGSIQFDKQLGFKVNPVSHSSK